MRLFPDAFTVRKRQQNQGFGKSRAVYGMFVHSRISGKNPVKSTLHDIFDTNSIALVSKKYQQNQGFGFFANFIMDA